MSSLRQYSFGDRDGSLNHSGWVQNTVHSEFVLPIAVQIADFTIRVEYAVKSCGCAGFLLETAHFPFM
jgi:hypothetical protein